MRKLSKTVPLIFLIILMVSCSSENAQSITSDELASKTLNYENSLNYARRINENLNDFLKDEKGLNQSKTENELVKEFIENYANETIDNLLSDINVTEKLVYDNSFSKKNRII